jgi:hypothetical protein
MSNTSYFSMLKPQEGILQEVERRKSRKRKEPNSEPTTANTNENANANSSNCHPLPQGP